MIALETVIDRVQGQNPSYTVSAARDKQPNFETLLNLPTIYIGYATLKCRNPEERLPAGFFDLHGEDISQFFDISICCEVENFRETWINIFKSLIGWNPNTLAANTSGFAYIEGGMMGLEQGRFWWLDRMAINFPTTNVNI
jgi:hypothetical protein